MKKGIIILFLFSSMYLYAGAPTWKVELDESIQNYHFLQDGKYLFFTNTEYLWLYDTKTGKEVYNMEIEDFEEEGIHQLIEEWYLVSTGDGVQCFDAVKGKKIWETEFDGISQSDFTEITAFDDKAVLRYDEDHVAFNFANGKEIWRTEIEYRGTLVDQGTWNYDVLGQLRKLMVLLDGGDLAIYDLNTGKQEVVIEDVEPNDDLIEKKFLWSYQPTDEKYYVIVTNDGAVLLDMVNNREIIRKEINIDGDYNVTLPTPNGCAILGEEKVVYFNFKDGDVKELPFPVDDMRTFKSYTVGDKGILIMSMEDQLFGIDLEAGEILWKTKQDDKNYEGYVHKYIGLDGENFICAYNRGVVFSEDNGTYIYCMNMNTLTGKLNYKTPVLLSQTVMTDFTRGLAKTLVGAFSTFVAVGSGGIAAGQAGAAIDMVSDMMGYGNIGFDYNVFEHNGNVVFESRTNVDMWNLDTRDGDGEGYVAVNKKIGEIVYKDYFIICEGIDQRYLEHIAPPLVVDNVSYIAGEERLYAFDLNAGKRIWAIDNNEKFELITDLKLIDGVLYVQFGKQHYTIGLKENEINVGKPLDVDPYGFKAIDATSGNILWTKETESSPGLFSPQFSFDNYYSTSTGLLYYSDEKAIYALKMGRDGGSFSWTFNYDDNKIGEMEYEETYAINERWIGSKVRTHSYTTNIGGGWAIKTTSTTGGIDAEESAGFIEDAAGADLFSTYTSWNNIWGVTAKRCLQVTTNGEIIIVFGPEGLGSINPFSGKANWVTSWEYDQEEVQYVPQIYKNSIVYCVDRELTLLDLSTGEEKWKVEEAKKPRFFTSPDKSQLFSIDDEVISGYDL